ncbi:hypothetical protein C3B55_00320 [Candidatus Pseudomonas adelgestsugas]|uniref:Uncharacterized protein n=1 Tax=Candidatus Pseudomonas adelgestsugas TaxID=1302376 RepID=A0ABX5R915_9PSED|nr:hypothetical protein C3B55_00320 [Candidatus Pseudomonas adelgestsugas]
MCMRILGIYSTFMGLMISLLKDLGYHVINYNNDILLLTNT